MATRKKQTKEDEIVVTESDLLDVMRFAQQYSSTMYQVFTPDMINARMKDVTLNLADASEENIAKCLSDPKNNEDLFLSIAQTLELISTPYKRALHYLASVPSFDFTVTSNAKDEKELQSKAYQKDYQEMVKFFDCFDYRAQFQMALRQILRGEMYTFVFRQDGEKYVFQELPTSQRYIKITGKWDYGYLTSMNMYWFMIPSVPINGYPDWFKKKFDELFGGKTPAKMYNPAIAVENRGYTPESNWVLWADLPPDIAWTFKGTEEIATRIPYFAGMFQDIAMMPLIRNLMRSKYIASAAKLLHGEVPLLGKDVKGGVTKDQFGISTDNLARFLGFIKSALGESSIKPISSPLTNMQGIEFALSPSDSTMYSDFTKNMLSLSGVNTSLLYNAEVKQNSTETLLSADVDRLLVEGMVYNQMERFLEYQVNKRTTKFKFRFKLEGSSLYVDRQRRLDIALQLADKGIVLKQKIAAALGMSPFDFDRQLMETRASGFVESLTPILSAFNASKEQLAEKGRPQKKQDELSDSGSTTRDAGSNIDKGGEV